MRTDLDAIAETGNRAEWLSHVRGGMQTAGAAATLVILKGFANLQRRYSSIMAVLQASRFDLENAGAPVATLAAADKILDNETAVVFRTVETNGQKKKVAVKSQSHEAVRAEIQKDASMLLEAQGVLEAMAKRKVDAAQIMALRDDAQALAGKLADRTAAKGAGKDAGGDVRDAVKEQKRVWGGVYRILALVGQADERVRMLLADSAR